MDIQNMSEQQRQNDQDQTIVIIVLGINSISIFFIILLFINYYNLKEKLQSYHIILIICFADAIWSIIMILTCGFYFLGDEIIEPFCQISSFLKVYFGLVGIFGTAIVTFKLLSEFNSNQNLTRKNYLFCFGFPLIFASTPIFLKYCFEEDGYNQVNPMLRFNCFIVPNHNNYISLYLCFYGPLWLVCFYHLYGITKFILNNYEGRNLCPNFGKLFFIPLVLIFCWIWVSIKRVSQFVSKNYPDDKPEILDYFDYSAIGLSGVLNSLYYGYCIKYRRNEQIIEDNENQQLVN